MKRIILHLDLDAFFTSVEEVKKPELKGKPLVVGADPKGGKGRGVVSTGNYESRKYSIFSGQPISIAWRKLKGTGAVFLPVNMLLYKKISSQIMEFLRKYADGFEQTSIDEAYLDISQKTGGSYEKAKKIAEKIKSELKKDQKLTCSIGISCNKLIAKIASDYKKPNGLTIVKENQMQEFLDSLSVRKLPGIGPKTQEKLNAIGIKTVKQLRKASLDKLKEKVGSKRASTLHQESLGIDESPVQEAGEMKSVGKQHTFQRDTDNEKIIFRTMQNLVEDSLKNLKEEGFNEYKTVTIKVRYPNFETHTSAQSLKEYHSDKSTAITLAIDLLRQWLDGKKIRLIGISLSKLK